MNASVSQIPQMPVYPRKAALNQEQAKRAKEFHRFLMDYSKDESEKELRGFYRATADFFREKVFGKSERSIQTAIRAALEEYFDGEKYIGIEIENLIELTGIKGEQLAPVLEKMIIKGEIVLGKRRRYNELGEHYNQIFKLKG